MYPRKPLYIFMASFPITWEAFLHISSLNEEQQPNRSLDWNCKAVGCVEGNYGCTTENKTAEQIHRNSSCNSEQGSNKVRNRRKPNLLCMSLLSIHKHAPALVKSVKQCLLRKDLIGALDCPCSSTGLDYYSPTFLISWRILAVFLDLFKINYVQAQFQIRVRLLAGSEFSCAE